MMKKLIKAGVLLIIFVAALIVSSLVINRGSGDQIVDMGAPTLPRVWFTLNGEKVNVLTGYVRDCLLYTSRCVYETGYTV